MSPHDMADQVAARSREASAVLDVANASLQASTDVARATITNTNDSNIPLEDRFPFLREHTGRRRSRQLLTADQTKVLLKILERTMFPSTAVREAAARDLGITPRKVQVFFQNKRQGFRKKMLAAAQDLVDLRHSEQSNQDRVAPVGDSSHIRHFQRHHRARSQPVIAIEHRIGEKRARRESLQRTCPQSTSPQTLPVPMPHGEASMGQADPVSLEREPVDKMAAPNFGLSRVRRAQTVAEGSVLPNQLPRPHERHGGHRLSTNAARDEEPRYLTYQQPPSDESPGTIIFKRNRTRAADEEGSEVHISRIQVDSRDSSTLSPQLLANAASHTLFRDDSTVSRSMAQYTHSALTGVASAVSSSRRLPRFASGDGLRRAVESSSWYPDVPRPTKRRLTGSFAPRMQEDTRANISGPLYKGLSGTSPSHSSNDPRDSVRCWWDSSDEHRLSGLPVPLRLPGYRGAESDTAYIDASRDHRRRFLEARRSLSHRRDTSISSSSASSVSSPPRIASTKRLAAPSLFERQTETSHSRLPSDPSSCESVTSALSSRGTDSSAFLSGHSTWDGAGRKIYDGSSGVDEAEADVASRWRKAQAASAFLHRSMMNLSCEPRPGSNSNTDLQSTIDMNTPGEPHQADIGRLYEPRRRVSDLSTHGLLERPWVPSASMWPTTGVVLAPLRQPFSSEGPLLQSLHVEEEGDHASDDGSDSVGSTTPLPSPLPATTQYARGLQRHSAERSGDDAGHEANRGDALAAAARQAHHRKLPSLAELSEALGVETIFPQTTRARSQSAIVNRIP
ncbi:unnamed protein product [Parajaminaea phylloscopi]